MHDEGAKPALWSLYSSYMLRISVDGGLTVAVVNPARRRHPESAIEVVARAVAVKVALPVSLDVAA